MLQLLDSPLVAAASQLDKPAVLGAGHAWSWHQIHEASIALARRLGTAAAVCNLCTSRASFLITWLAALRQRCLMILPPSGGSADLGAILDANSNPFVVADDPQVIQLQWRAKAQCLIYQADRQPAQAKAAELAWQPAWDHTAVLLYTSGSTGAPEPQPKTLRQLATGAVVLGQRLEADVTGGMAAIERIVCSVPPQHMFGLECSVMLSLVHAIPVLDRRPMLPAEVRDAFADVPAGAWVATPLHLRNLALAGEAIPHCSVVIASTMPLAQALAQQTEALVAAPVLEIYGTTETGVMAMRRTAKESNWRPVSSVRLESADGVTRAHGSHFASPVVLPDQVDIDAAGRFSLLGRQADLIKIAGRRASLAGLNLLLQDLPGLEDGVFYLPATGSATERLCLIHSGPALDRAAMLGWLRERLDPVFLPRTVIRVERLPRSDSGKLPRLALDQLYDAWKASTPPPASNRFEFTVPADHPALPGHFPGRPIVPGVLLLDQVMTQVRTAMKRPVSTLNQVKFVAPLLPGEVATVQIEADGPRVKFSVRTQRAGIAVLLASGKLSLLEPTGDAR